MVYTCPYKATTDVKGAFMYIFDDKILSNISNIKDIIFFAETEAVTDNIVTEYFANKIITDYNAYTSVASKGITVGDCLKKLVISDIKMILEAALQLRSLQNYVPSRKQSYPCVDYCKSMQSVCASKDENDLYEALTKHLNSFGLGHNGRYLAYVWQDGLKGVTSHDISSLDSLYCIDRQKKVLTDNTEAFLNGKGANNVLLYGNSGCGKSTSVKALLNKYHKDGLRLVQLDKEQIPSLPSLIRTLSGMPFKYIIFIDDLSFEENDGDYKPLKTALEGRVEGQADNVLFYATSNRFHIINETWAERKGDDIHASDTRNERMSLSERFGIRIHFISPSQVDYLKIVENILKENGVEVNDSIRNEALKWEVYYNGKSGRTASQFVRAYLSGNLEK